MPHLKHRLCAIALSASGLVIVADAAVAQQPRPVSLDATLGGGVGLGGGEFRYRGAGALDALLSLRLRAAGRHALLTGVSAGFQGLWFSDDMCVRGSRGQCLNNFPALSPVALLGGWEGRRGRGASPGTTLRVLAGPAYIRVDGDDSAGQRGSTLGAQARVDLASPPLGPLALVASLRGTAVPRFRGQTLGTWGGGIGMRLR